MPRFDKTRFAIPLKVAAAALLGSAFSAAAVNAESVEEFYRGKQIRLIVGNAVGADYDLGARLLARHMSRHMPGSPTILVQNMPGRPASVPPTISPASVPRMGHFSAQSRAIFPPRP